MDHAFWLCNLCITQEIFMTSTATPRPPQDWLPRLEALPLVLSDGRGLQDFLARDTSRISRDASSFMRFERKFKENGIRFEYLSKPDNELPVTPMMEAFETAYKKRRTKAPKHFG